MAEGTQVQFELFRKLTELGYTIVPELRMGRLRADLALYHSGRLALLLECKGSRARRSKTKQRQKYRATGIPYVYCFGYADVDICVEIVKALFPPSEEDWSG